MAVYLVPLHATGISATMEDVERHYDLLKNEYVWARSAGEAIEKARVNVRSALRAYASIRQEDIPALPLVVDECRDNQSVLNLMKKQGFVFCRTEKPASVTEVPNSMSVTTQ